MVKKRNRRTRKKYKKRGGFTDEELQACNDRLESQGVKSRVNRLRMCNDSNATASLDTQEPVQQEIVQPIAQPKEPTELKQSSGVERVIAPLEEESSKPSIKDRASALEKKFGETGVRKTRKALKTTIGACRAAINKEGIRYYYNEAGESTYDSDDEICHPTDGIEKTGKKVGDCEEARYKGGPAYLYHPQKGFSTRNYNYHGCFETQELITVTNKKFPNTSFFKLKQKVESEPLEKVEEEKMSQVDCSELSNTKCKKSPDCDLVTTKIPGKSNNKKNKKKKCLPKKIGGKRTKRTKRKKSRKKRKKSRKRRR